MSASERGYSPGWRRFSTWVLQPLLHILIKQKMQGRENLPREGGLILAPNHLSYADWGTVALFSYEAGRYPTFLIKSSIFNVKGVGPILRKLGQLPVYRNRGDAALVLRDAERALRSGECVVVYPEGTASRDPEQWRPGRAALRQQPASPVAAQDGANGGRAAGGPVGIPRPAAELGDPGRRHRGRHGRGDGAAGGTARRNTARRPLRPRRTQPGRGPDRPDGTSRTGHG
jgi:1-acyl-sn-glycerol-3-phosphate acyltransferase